MIVNTALEMPFARFASIEIFEVNVASISESAFDGSVQIQSFQGEYWRANLQFPKFEREKGEIVSAFLSKLRGPAGTFLLPDTSNALPRGTAATVASSPTLNGSGQIGATISVKGAALSQTGWLLAGDVIQIGPADRAHFHKVLDDVDTTAGGLATINIWPTVRQPNIDGDPIVTEDPKGLFFLTETARRRLLTPPFRYDIPISVREVL
jgi:hypothetical protein